MNDCPNPDSPAAAAGQGPARRGFRLPAQLVRLVLLTVGIVVSYLAARYVLTPVSFGQYGWYRGNALAEIAAREPVYAGKAACDECHSEVLEKIAKGEHQTVSCESCHGVSRAHAEDPDVKPVKLTGSHCIRCHEANPSRPAWFHQIKVREHYGERCTDCHKPHQPNEVP
ncbi:MAG: cytochrome C [Verrucomicrobia bacterium]|nr:cytochrome C [Verrucomicrobiota bacterium]